MSHKATPGLQEKLLDLPMQEHLEVVLELGQEALEALDHAHNLDEMKQIFATVTRPVKARIQSMGGQITGEVCLNGTLQAQLTKRAVESLDEEHSVAKIDLPRSLSRD
jgi:hypothetical protein